jgi:hypothetical protein
MSNGWTQQFGEDGETERFDDLQEAIGFAKTMWEGRARHLRLVIRDTQDEGSIVWAAQAGRQSGND